MKSVVTQARRMLTDIGYYLSGGKLCQSSSPSALWVRRDNRVIMRPGSGGVSRYVEHAQLSFSLIGEDRLLWLVFSRQSQGFYIDIGAFHPFQYSNTAIFYRAGWRGINIEPNPTAMALFRQHRPEDENLNLGVGQEKGELDYYMFSDPALNTFSSEYARFVIEQGKILLKKTRVQVLPLREILDKYFCGKGCRGEIDFMNVDCETYDYEVLLSNDWDRWRPKIVLVECHEHLQLFENHSRCCCTVLEQQEYRKIASMIATHFFVDNKIKFPFF